ncbi:MAG: hypothetical protein J6N52_10730 [Clostridia bacterium]|nr:hypothetical protein [Clostridia bacterium]
MLENLYTTKMSSSKRVLQRRFTKIRSKSGRTAKIMSLVMTLALALALGAATVVMAAVDGLEIDNGIITVNGKKQTIDIQHFENSDYLSTDSYFVPLRKVFEMLGCKVNYNVPKSSVPDYMKGVESFPYYAWEGKENLVTDFVTQQIYGATTGANANMPIIEVVSESGEKWYCQIGSEQYTNAWAPPVLLIDNTAYISIRAIAYYLIPENEDVDYSILWDSVAHDTYYSGRLTFDDETLTLTIDTGAKAGNSPHVDTLKSLLTNEALKVVQRMESRNYVVCMIENYSRANAETCLSIDKATGKTAQLDTFPSDTAFRLRLSFTDGNHLTLKQIVAGSDELQDIKQYDLSNQQYNLRADVPRL